MPQGLRRGLGAAAPGERVGGNVTQSENFAFIVAEGETSPYAGVASWKHQ